MVWHIGNTTVRTPYRLREALLAISGSPLNGNLRGYENENALAKLLHSSDVVNVQRIEINPEADASDLGRKWRSALSQLGFITHKVENSILIDAGSRVSGTLTKSFEITPNGYRLINSDPITAQQESFLKSLLAYRIPSIIETRQYSCTPFNPLKFVIDILFGLMNAGAENYISFVEFALFVQTSSPDDGLDNIIGAIIDYRRRKKENEGRIRAFTNEEYFARVGAINPGIANDKIDTKAQTLDDYADLTLRYLKATAIFSNKGHGITFNPVKEALANIINKTNQDTLTDIEYLINLWQGAKLPSDESDAASQIIDDLALKIASLNGKVSPISLGQDIGTYRHYLEEYLLQLQENNYYKDQATKTKEILAWLNALQGKPLITKEIKELIKIPRGEGPAYFEWIIWRAFLAINSLTNHPWEARRFQIDQDFLPVHTAPGNGPDMVFEFEDTILVIEVTLTSSSRQEAAEGESVRRHVAKYAEEQNKILVARKQVYGLFIALNIDNNTAHTFRLGDWYIGDEKKLNLHIVPMNLGDFTKLFEYGADKLPTMPTLLKNLLINCRMEANQDAPVWKRSITKIIEQSIDA